MWKHFLSNPGHYVASIFILFGIVAAGMNMRSASASLVVNTNMSSVEAMNRLQATQAALSRSFSRISSGLRINAASDDAAGLGVSEALEAHRHEAETVLQEITTVLTVVSAGESVVTTTQHALTSLGQLAATDPAHPERRRAEATRILHGLTEGRQQLRDVRPLAHQMRDEDAESMVRGLNRVIDEIIPVASNYFRISRSGSRLSTRVFQNTISQQLLALQTQEQAALQIMLNIDAMANDQIQEAEDFMGDETTNAYFEFPSTTTEEEETGGQEETETTDPALTNPDASR